MESTVQTSLRVTMGTGGLYSATGLARKPQAIAPATAVSPKMARVFSHPTHSASGAAAAIERAIPRLRAAVFSPFMIRTSFGLNHRIKIGPVVVMSRAAPAP